MNTIDYNRRYNELLQMWQRDMHKMFLLVFLAKEAGIDLDWVLKADDETVMRELKRRPQEVVHITDPLKPWTP